ITTLAELPAIQVTSRTSVMQFKQSHQSVVQIGRALGVDALIQGAILRDGSRMRITVQLVDAMSDQHLWAKQYERNVGDVLTIQGEIARAVADEIRLKVSPGQLATLARRRSVDPAAHEAYLRGRYHLNQGDEPNLHKAIDDFTDAIAHDADDAPSHAGLASVY